MSYQRTVMVSTEWPIYINSKGRPECKTAKLLPEGRFKIVVEPQDYDAYVKQWGKKHVLVLDKNDQGIAYVRDFTVKHNQKLGKGWFWLLDDDISNFFKEDNGKNVKSTFLDAEKYVKKKLKGQEKFAIASLEYSQYAWSAKGRVTINSYCDVCVLIHAQKVKEIGAEYDLRFKLKSDRDFALQVMSKGFNCVRFTKFSFGCPENGSNKGGLHETYSKKSPERISCIMLEEKWGTDLVNVTVKKSGRVDAKINWKAFKK